MNTSTPSTTTHSNNALQSRMLAALLRGWLEKYNRTAKFSFLLELVRSLRYLIHRANIMTNNDDLTAMVFINAERFIDAYGCIDETLHTLLFTSFTITAKVCEDDRLFNAHIAQACGMKLEFLNKMERRFLTHLQFDVILSREQVDEFYLSAIRRWEGRPSITKASSSFSVSRIVSGLLHSPSKSKPPATRTLSTPTLKTVVSPSSSSSSRPPATRTISTPSFSTATFISSSSTSSTTTTSAPTTTTTTKPVSSSPIQYSPRPVIVTRPHLKRVSKQRSLEKVSLSTKFLNFFRARDE